MPNPSFWFVRKFSCSPSVLGMEEFPARGGTALSQGVATLDDAGRESERIFASVGGEGRTEIGDGFTATVCFRCRGSCEDWLSSFVRIHRDEITSNYGCTQTARVCRNSVICQEIVFGFCDELSLGTV